MSSPDASPRVAVIGGGPAGLMAAEVLAAGGARVELFDAMPSVGRKFLLAGKGGLNLTHSEPFDAFAGRFGPRRGAIEPLLRRFGANELRAWATGLGIDSFIGSSGRVFPRDMKAAPLLRAWLTRLRASGVAFHMRHRWLGWSVDGALRFDTPHGELTATPAATVLALGGASWSRLGSDGVWVPWLEARGIEVAPLRPSNCGFDVAGWSDFIRARFAGQPMKNVALTVDRPRDGGPPFQQAGEFIATDTGVEGSLVYAASAALREQIDARGQAVAWLDLLPARDAAFVQREVAHPRGSRSLSTHLKTRLGLDGIKTALLHELLPRDAFADPARLAAALKALPLPLVRPRPLDEAISSAGGVRFEALDDTLMARAVPGLFIAGEMLDWEAPTGGYLLTASIASAVTAATGALQHLTRPPPPQ